MKNKRLVIFDTEEKYAVFFADYVNERRSSPFRAQAFSSLHKLKAYAEKQSIDVLLVGSQCMGEEIIKLGVEKVILLSAGSVCKKYEQYPAVYKYQSSDVILKAVLSHYAEHAADGQIGFSKPKNMQMIGIYSPIRQTQKTSFAFALGQELAKTKNTLYINLEDFSGFDVLLGRQSMWNLSDLIYFLRQKKDTFLYKLNSVIQNFGDLDYISPMVSPLDIRAVKREEWELLFEQLAEKSSYEVLLLDFGDYVDDIFQLLNRCQVVYTPILSDKISRAKMVQYENLLYMLDFEKLFERTRQIVLPCNERFLLEQRTGQELVWPEMRNYVEELEVLKVLDETEEQAVL